MSQPQYHLEHVFDSPNNRPGARVWLIAGLLFLIAASRILRIGALELDNDEAWSIWQTLGSPGQIVAWTPYDWPPLYYLALGAWKEAAGISPIAARAFSALLLLPGTAALYRVVRRRAGHSAGALAMLAYSAWSYLIYLSLLVRGYVILIALLPVAVWLTERYFFRPGWRRAVPLALALTAMFYTHLTAVVPMIMLGLFTLATQRRAIWRWTLPIALMALLVAPLIVDKLALATGESRREALSEVDLPPLPQALWTMFRDNAGYGAAIWVIVIAAAVFGLMRARRSAPLQPWLWLGWGVLGALALYVLNPLFGFFQVRYAWWLALGLSIAIGWGLSRWRWQGQVAAAGLLITTLFLPLPLTEYRGGMFAPPFIANLRWLHAHAAPGDALVIDPSVFTVPEMWDYYLAAYWPPGLKVTDDPAGWRRVWYATVDGWEDADLARAVRADRVAGAFVGPWDFLFRLYEAPPDPQGVLFENGMRFHGVDVERPEAAPHTPLAVREGERLRLRLWWSVAPPIERDYSISIRLVASDQTIVAQLDSAPQVPGEPPETSRWQGDRFYVEDRMLSLPDNLQTGTYKLYLIVYQWWDNERISAPEVNDETMLLIDTLAVKSW